MSVKFKSLLLLKAHGTMLKCFGGSFLFTVLLFLTHISPFFIIWRMLCFQEEFHASGVECSVNKTAVSRLAAWSLLPGASSLDVCACSSVPQTDS